MLAKPSGNVAIQNAENGLSGRQQKAIGMGLPPPRTPVRVAFREPWLRLPSPLSRA